VRQVRVPLVVALLCRRGLRSSSSPARDGRYDGDRVVLADGGLTFPKVAYIFVVQVYIHKVAEPAALVEYLLPQIRILRGKALKHRIHGAARQPYLFLLPRVLPQGRWDYDSRHSFSSSSSNALRSSRSFQARIST